MATASSPDDPKNTKKLTTHHLASIPKLNPNFEYPEHTENNDPGTDEPDTADDNRPLYEAHPFLGVLHVAYPLDTETPL